MQTLTDQQLRQLARKRIEFKSHLIAYCIIIGSCWIIWAVMGRNYPWPIWPMVGWGVGLVFHYLFEYRPSTFLSEEAEYRKLKEKHPAEENASA
ncbi:MAG TPA: 2TM domain-containing protein [Flavisolibacter sp.]|nr:2TM domain-containing protein [Flavisolibacter sp.]